MSRFEFKMPRLGESITDAAIITWFKNIGDTIEQDEMLLEVATDKVDSEVPSTVSGIVEEILFEANEVIKIGDVIAIINTNGIVESSRKPVIKKAKKEEPSKTDKRKRNLDINSKDTNTFFSPLIISIAKEHYISFEELARIPSTGKMIVYEKLMYSNI